MGALIRVVFFGRESYRVPFLDQLMSFVSKVGLCSNQDRNVKSYEENYQVNRGYRGIDHEFPRRESSAVLIPPTSTIESFEVIINPANATLPVVVTSAGSTPSAVSISAAGEVTATGNDAPFVTVYYGTIDGGEVPGAWDSLVDGGAQVGAFTTLIEGLTPNTNYFYRMFASNSAGSVWADSSEMVMTLSPLDSKC